MRQVRNSWKTARNIMACCGIFFALLAFGACRLPSPTSNATRLPTATEAPTLPATPTSAEIQATVKTNRATFANALEIANSGNLFSGISDSQIFHSSDGKILQSGTFEYSDTTGFHIATDPNVRYVGKLTTSEGMTDKNTQPILLFATNGPKGIEYLMIQLYSTQRDGANYTRDEVKDINHIQPQNFLVTWGTTPFVPNSEGTGTFGTEFKSINDVTNSPLGLVPGNLYELDLHDDQNRTKTSWTGSNPTGNAESEASGLYQLVSVIDSAPNSIATVKYLGSVDN